MLPFVMVIGKKYCFGKFFGDIYKGVWKLFQIGFGLVFRAVFGEIYNGFGEFLSSTRHILQFPETERFL